jgi:hypothetical protein
VKMRRVGVQPMKHNGASGEAVPTRGARRIIRVPGSQRRERADERIIQWQTSPSLAARVQGMDGGLGLPAGAALHAGRAGLAGQPDLAADAYRFTSATGENPWRARMSGPGGDSASLTGSGPVPRGRHATDGQALSMPLFPVLYDG